MEGGGNVTLSKKKNISRTVTGIEMKCINLKKMGGIGDRCGGLWHPKRPGCEAKYVGLTATGESLGMHRRRKWSEDFKNLYLTKTAEMGNIVAYSYYMRHIFGALLIGNAANTLRAQKQSGKKKLRNHSMYVCHI